MFFKALAKFKALSKKKPLQEQHDFSTAHFQAHNFNDEISPNPAEHAPSTKSTHATINSKTFHAKPHVLPRQSSNEPSENENEDAATADTGAGVDADGGAPSETQWGVLSSRPKAKDPSRRSVAGGDAGWGGSSRRQSLTRAGRHKSVHYSNLGDAALHLRANPRKRPSIAQALSQRQKMLLSEDSGEAGLGALSVS